MNFKPVYFVAAWTLLNLFNAACTELTSDEGYYWYYSSSLEWGYYDHPPFTAWIIWIGYALFENELGVRLVNVLLLSVAALLFFRIVPVERKHSWVVYLLFLSVPLLNYFGIILFPDGPMQFFLILFLFAYQRFLQDKKLWIAVLLAFSIAGMLYSKYYGALVVILTVFSNLKLAMERRCYLVLLLAFLLYVPHLAWQWRNGFPSFQYHLSARVSSWSGKHVLEYISQQIPAIGPALLLIPFVVRSRNQFERTLFFIAIGTFAFFFIVSFRAFVHFHWTSITILPLLYLGARYYAAIGRRKLLLWLTIPFILVILIARLQLSTNVLSIDSINIDNYHGRKKWALEVAAFTQGRPLVFINNFREPPLYSFYSGQFSGTVYTGEKRKSQYDIYGFEDSIQQKQVVLIQRFPFNGSIELKTLLGTTWHVRNITEFSSYYNVPIKATVEKNDPDSISVSIEIRNDRSTPLYFHRDSDSTYPSLVSFVKMRGNPRYVRAHKLMVLTGSDQINPGKLKTIRLNLPKRSGQHEITHYSFGFRHGLLPDSYNAFVKTD